MVTNEEAIEPLNELMQEIKELMILERKNHVVILDV